MYAKSSIIMIPYRYHIRTKEEFLGVNTDVTLLLLKKPVGRFTVF